jgi:hypothetical protein
MKKLVFKEKMRFFISICLLFFVLFQTAAQEQPPLGDLNQFVIENLQFPKGELSQGNKGRMILSLKINNEGLPDSVFVSQASTEIFNAECMRVMELIIQNWKPSFLGDRAVGEEYLLVFSFSVQVGNSGFSDKYAQLERLMKKEKYEKAMALIDQKIEENPFDSYDYLTRSEIHRHLGNTEDSQKDFMTARQLKKKILVNAEVTAFGIPRPPSSP